MKYQVTIKTGDQAPSGTNSDIKLKIIGTKGETEFCELDHFFHDDFQHGTTETYNIVGDDVGDVECLSIYAKPMIIDIMTCEWYIDYIIVTQDPPSGKMVLFPVHQWITKHDHCREFFISTNKTCLPQNESEARHQDNRRASQLKKDIIKWQGTRYHDGLPGHIEVDGGHEEIPDINVRFTDGKNRQFTHNAIKARGNATWKRMQLKTKSFHTFDDYKEFSKGLKEDSDLPPWVHQDTWKTDEEFGRQILNGTNPVNIKRCRKLPDNFPVTDEHVQCVLTRGRTLQEEMDDGKIYIVDHNILQNISTGTYKGKRIELAAPLCLFYVREDNKFVPIAIQLGQNPGPDFPIWSPRDKPLDWLLVKIWFKNADLQIMQMPSHLAYTHLLLEPFAVALFRCLPPPHPIHKLLREYLQFVIAINTIGRDKLVQPVK